MISLTRPQANLLRYIAGYVEAHGYGPTYNEMRDGLGYANRGAIHRLIVAIEERGAIGRIRIWPCFNQRARAIFPKGEVAIPRAPDGEPLFAVPGFGPLHSLAE